MTAQPILQFGTSRFLQAHVDLFVSEALAGGGAGAALGGITVVQTTHNPASAQRVAALAAGAGYPVRIRGLAAGARVDRTITCTAVRSALRAEADWPAIRDAIAGDVRVVVSNTADRGYEFDAADDRGLVDHRTRVPASFPAKLLVLLHHRWRENPGPGLSIFPCELVSRNGDTLRDLAATLARAWSLAPAFVDWLREHCAWGNSLVDRIVSEPIEPVGAVAEPYALWAIESRPRLVVPCRHEAIVLTERLDRYERLKLFLLNGGHTWLAERWRRDGRPATETVLQAMSDPPLCADLESLWRDEMLPVFDALGEGTDARAYLEVLRERLLNPFLEHRLAEIANNHAQKKQRRFAPIVALAAGLKLELPQPRLRAALAV